MASRRLVDLLRSDTARRRREDTAALATPPALLVEPPADEPGPDAHDDTLTLLFLCCHPSLSPPSQVALTLRAVGGLATGEIARAFLVPEATMAQRIARAKAGIRAAGAIFSRPDQADFPARLQAVLQVTYLVFNEGYTATAGPALQRPDLTGDAIRLARLLHRLLPGDGEVAGLLALMLLTDARRGARTGPDGSLIPLTEQDWRPTGGWPATTGCTPPGLTCSSRPASQPPRWRATGSPPGTPRACRRSGTWSAGPRPSPARPADAAQLPSATGERRGETIPGLSLLNPQPTMF